MTWVVAALFGCPAKDADVVTSSTPTPTTGTTVNGFVPFEPAPATLFRVTDAEWRNSASDLFGATFQGPLPVDYLLYNYSRVGGSTLTIPPLDLELYESAAWSVGTTMAPDDGAAELLTGCQADDLPCVRGWTAGRVEHAWRRPATPQELDELMDRYASEVGDNGAAIATQATVAAILLAPDFLFRVELGQPDPDHDGWRQYTSYEMAGRLASLLLLSVPDDELLRAADAGELLTPDGIGAQVDRLIGGDRAKAAMQTFFTETVELQQLDSVTKDQALYPEWTQTLRDQARGELVDLFTDVAMTRDASLGELLTSNRAVVGPELGGLYGTPVGAEGSLVDLPTDRAGLLGRVGFLAIQAHNTTTSPTFRGKFVRTRLLCDNIPPPPPGVKTDLPPVEDGTLRDVLEQHETDPVCAGCHVLLDPPGFGLEHYDPIGRWRDQDNGHPIDATGDIDGATFDGAQELADVVAASPKYPKCLATQLYRFTNGQFERPEDLGSIDAVGTAFANVDGQRFQELVKRLLIGDPFRLATAPLGEACTTDGAVQSCATACGTGVETCTGGVWRGCNAPAPGVETCNGVDDDCNSDVDDVERSCAGDFGPGTQVCDGTGWTACTSAAPPAEICNGVDDDLDGAVDEGLSVAVVATTYQDLTDLGHYSCDAKLDPFSPACHAAASRYCAQTGCARTGFGPVDLRAGDLDLTCLDDTQATVIPSTFTELSGYHSDCNQGSRQGGACNAAINRLCGSRGLVTGFGPVENSGDNATIVCTPTAVVLNGSYGTLSTFDAECNASTREGSACNHAIHEWCRSQGYVSGHGPLENSGDLAVVACIGVQ